ncbi:MAG: translation initiation factor Sui1 [Desulfobulbaceae bacterium]|nr:translation initiation factor Sui1 [Desulfobulbaceae bacterium]
MKRTNTNGGLVYSTDRGRTCPGCGMPAGQCSCSGARPGTRPAGDGIVRISRETKGRKGAGVTLLRGLGLAPEQLKALAGQLKQRCGSGGTVKDGVIEIQGDHRQLLLAELARQGFKVKLAGG